jgi:phasin family protein
MLTAEQVMAAQKANVQTLFGLTGKAFEGVEKLVELNMQVAKTAFEEASNAATAALSVKDAQELLSLQASFLQPTAEKAAAYSRHVYDITAATNAEVTKAAEKQLADAQSKFLGLVDSASKNAPAGTENAVALMRSAVSAADVADANIQAMTNTAVKAAQQTTSRAKRAA